MPKLAEPGRDEPAPDKRLQPLRSPDRLTHAAERLRQFLEKHRDYRVEIRMHSAGVEIDLILKKTGQKLRTAHGSDSMQAIRALVQIPAPNPNDRR